ncbi:unnamed protein product [Urochloa humidicola]
MAAALPDELVEEILVHLPPDDPAHLVRAALVCKRWSRLISAPTFRRRLRDSHGAAPVLGFLYNIDGYDEEFHYQYAAYFDPTTTSSFLQRGRRAHHYQNIACFFPTSSAFRLRRGHFRRCWSALDARHGRVLLRSKTWRKRDPALLVWDPVTGWEQELNRAPRCSNIWNAAVLCGGGGDCDHLDCRSRPFLVVVVASASSGKTFVDVYSSETNAWSKPAYALSTGNGSIHPLQPGVLVENALYFRLQSYNGILEFNLCTRRISVIQLPPTFDRPKPIPIIIMMDGELGFAMVRNSKVYLWVREVSPNEGGVGWTQRRIIELENVLPADARFNRANVVGFVDSVSLIFVDTENGLFAIDLKSQLARNVHKWRTRGMVIPYVTFYTLALGTASTYR